MTDLFQLLGQQQKTGTLNLKGERKVIQVFFDKGLIVGATFPAKTAEENPLGERLIRGGLLSPGNWQKARDQQKEELLSIGQILVKNSMVRKEDITAVLRLLSFEAIYSLFKWKGGTFWFDAKPVYYDPNFVEPLNAEYLLLDVLRMVDEWPLLEKRFPAFEMVLQKVNSLNTLDVLSGTPWEENRSFQMEVIYDLVNGQRTVQEIIDLSFVGEFDTCKNLIILMDAGVVEPALISATNKKGKGIQVSKYLLSSGAYLLLSVLAFFLIYQLANARWNRFPLSQEEWRGWQALHGSFKGIEDAKTGNAREVFFVEENRYPKNLNEMRERGLLAR